MTEHTGNVDVSTRVRHVRAQLSEWERDIPIEQEIQGKPPEEIIRLVMEEKELVEERLKIIGQNFPGVHEDAKNVVDLSQRLAVESSPDSIFKMYQERDGIFQAYERNNRRMLRPVFILAVKDFFAYEAISWEPR